MTKRSKNKQSVTNLEPSNPIHHPLELNSLDILVFTVHPLNPEDVVAEVQAFEPPLLGQEHDHHAPCPVETLAEQLLHRELILTN